MLRWLVLILWPGLVLAQMQPYSAADLARVEERAVPNLRAVFEEDIIRLLPRALRPRAREISLEFPAIGRGPLDFYARPDTQTIYMPLTSIRFYDDLATLYAWFEAKSCDPAYLQSYLSELLGKGTPLETPLEAFDVDRDVAFADSYTYSLSGKIYSSGLQFILAHEMGHLMQAHRTDVSLAESRRQESEADAFAMEHFARLGGNPMGVFFYYQMAWWTDPTRAKRVTSTHPVSAERIRAMGARMLQNPIDFAHGEEDPNREAGFVAQLGQMIIAFADQIDDDDFLVYSPELMARDYPVSRLKRACPS